MKIRPLMLTPTFAKNVKAPGRYGDGRGGLGLSLLVRPASRGGFTKSWTQYVRIGGRPTSLGLGRYPVVTLAMARERALENARAIADGRDPRGGSPVASRPSRRRWRPSSPSTPRTGRTAPGRPQHGNPS